MAENELVCTIPVRVQLSVKQLLKMCELQVSGVATSTITIIASASTVTFIAPLPQSPTEIGQTMFPCTLARRNWWATKNELVQKAKHELSRPQASSKTTPV